MKQVLYGLICLISLYSCGNLEKSASSGSSAGLSLKTEHNPEWQYKNMRIYPIELNAQSEDNVGQMNTMLTTAEAMGVKGFRITELKQFGRASEGSVNALTVANKSTSSVFIMSGDVVTGGKQDRVIATDQVIAANSLKNIDVFCVEPHRWRYFDSNATESEKNVGAFKGYYNVASSRIRHTIQNNGNQQDVWDMVAKVTESNGVKSTTGTYTALEQSGDKKEVRDAYLNFFEGKFDQSDKIVGVIVVNGDKILGVDIFGNPSLFKRKFKSILHGYLADISSDDITLSAQMDNLVKNKFEQMLPYYMTSQNGDAQVGKFTYEGKLVHLSSSSK